MKPTQCSIGKCGRESLPGIPVCINHGVGIWTAMHDIVAERLNRPHGDRLLTRQQVRTMIPALRPATLRSWVARGQLPVAQVTTAGAPMYWLSDVEANMHKAEGALPRSKTAHDAIVYYLRLADGRIKIGTTTNLKVRMADLRRDMDQVLATEPGGRDVEALRHRQFSEVREGRREDFNPSPALMEHVAGLAERMVG